VVKKGTIQDPTRGFIVTCCGCARNFKGLNIFWRLPWITFQHVKLYIIEEQFQRF